MILPDPNIFDRPLHVWLGMVLFLLVSSQILIGTRILKLPFWLHTRVIWILILAIMLIHGFYGLEIYFLR
jgi:hypothetical protein